MRSRSLRQAGSSADKPVAWTIIPPIMSWDIPIEEEILKFVRTMAGNMEIQAAHNIWGGTRKGAQAYVNAYRTVENHIVSEMKLRASIKADRLTDERTAAKPKASPLTEGEQAK